MRACTFTLSILEVLPEVYSVPARRNATPSPPFLMMSSNTAFRCAAPLHLIDLMTKTSEAGCSSKYLCRYSILSSYLTNIKSEWQRKNLIRFVFKRRRIENAIFNFLPHVRLFHHHWKLLYILKFLSSSPQFTVKLEILRKMRSKRCRRLKSKTAS